MSNTPGDDDDELEYDDFNERFVDFIRQWGIAEYLLDAVISMIIHHHGVLAIGAAPITLERKLDFLKKARKELPALSNIDDILGRVIRNFSDEKDLRNTIVHGFPLKVEANHTAHFMRARPTAKGLDYQLRIVRPGDWNRLWRTSTDIWADLYLATFILDPNPADTPPDQGQEAARRHFMELAAIFPGSKRLRSLLQEVFSGDS